MLDNEREKLYAAESEYLNIGITADGARCKGISVPWVKTARAFNMRRPHVYIAPEDLHDAELMDKIRSFRVQGCYVFCPLEEYGFLAGFKDLTDIYLANAVNLKDLSFLESLQAWKMLNVENASLPDLAPIPRSLQNSEFRLVCLSFACCAVEDVSALRGMRNIDELIIIGKDDDSDRAKWEQISADTRRYYKV